MSDGDLSDDTALTVRVSLAGTNAAASDTVQLYNGTNALGTATSLTGTDITNGYIDITTATLSNGNSYNLRASVIDVAGNESPLSTDGTFDITIDTTAPTLSSSTPADNATDVGLTSDIVLNFDENIALGSGNIVISDGSQIITIDVASHGGQLSVSGTQLTINPTDDLANDGSNYNVQIASTAITDTAGNAYSGISDTSTLNFTTELGIQYATLDTANGTYTGHTTLLDNTVYIIDVIVASDRTAFAPNPAINFDKLDEDDTLRFIDENNGGIYAWGNSLVQYIELKTDAILLRYNALDWAVKITEGGVFQRGRSGGFTTVDLWGNTVWDAIPNVSYWAGDTWKTNTAL